MYNIVLGLVIFHLLSVINCNHLIPLSTLHHLFDDVETTDQLSIHNDLRESY